MTKMLDTICSKSFTDINFDLDNRSIKYCCKTSRIDLPQEITVDFFNSNSILERRKDLFNGVKHKDCVHCWQDNDNNKPSYRDLHNQWSNIKDIPVDLIEQSNFGNIFINHIEIKLDKTCDMSCVYCSPLDSSKIFMEEMGKEHMDISTESDVIAIIDWISIVLESLKNNPRRINILFMGGEPTLSKKFARFVTEIERLIPKGFEEYIKFGMVSNCNSTEATMKKVIQLIENSKCSWNIGISNESMYQNAERTRIGLKWDQFEKNIKTYMVLKNINAFTLCPAINLLTFNNFYEYIQWFFKVFKELECTKLVQIVGNFVANPTEIDISNLSKDNLKYCDELERLFNEVFVGHEKEVAMQFITHLRNRIGTSYKADHDCRVVEFLSEKSGKKKNQDIIKLYRNLKNIKW